MRTAIHSFPFFVLALEIFVQAEHCPHTMKKAGCKNPSFVSILKREKKP
jgi:hypothetical protein